jgi:hypothetical protein
LGDGGALDHLNLRMVEIDLNTLGNIIRLVWWTGQAKLIDGHAVWDAVVPAECAYSIR